MAKNIYNAFRRVTDLPGVGQGFSKRYDEPSYLTFKLKFGDGDENYNKAGQANLSDLMPHPLFNMNFQISFPPKDDAQETVPINVNTTKDVPLMKSRGIQQNATSKLSSKRANQINVTPSSFELINNFPLDYSAVRYLLESNEPTRAEMLIEFIEKFNSLQNEFNYYFQEIEGLNEILKTDTIKGQRVLNDQKITITCLEGLDLRMSYLMTLYKKIVWDDIYQRWVLPDMMRYFTLKIYLAEFRTFHEGHTHNVGLSALGNKQPPMFLRILDSVLPTWEITCEMCEFDISEMVFDHLSGLKVNTDPVTAGMKLVIKVGNVKELQIYPEFTHMFLSDKVINSNKRASDTINTFGDTNNQYMYPALLQVAQNRDTTTTGSDEDHASGLPYNENINKDTIFDGELRPAGEAFSNYETGKMIISPRYTTSTDPTGFGANTEQFTNPTQPETWVGNAISFGKAYATGFANKIIDKAKMTNIPGLGVSFSEAKVALQSKNVISVIGLIRKGVYETTKGYSTDTNAPSSRLASSVQTDTIMKSFLSSLQSLTPSEATDDDTLILQAMANVALNDKGVWEKIVDYSMATDLVGANKEINTPNPLDPTYINPGTYKPLSVPSSGMPIVLPNAASGDLSATPVINKGTASSTLGSTTQPTGLQTIAPSESLNGTIQSVEFKSGIKTTKIESAQIIEFSPTSAFNKTITDNLIQPTSSEKLSNKIQI